MNFFLLLVLYCSCWVRLLIIQDVAMILFLLNFSCVLLYVNCIIGMILPGNGVLRNQTGMVVTFVLRLMR